MTPIARLWFKKLIFEVNALGTEPKYAVRKFCSRKKKKKMNGLTVGRIVHFVFREGDPKLKLPVQVRPAIVTNILDKENGVVNLCVFLDMPNDRMTPEATKRFSNQPLGSSSSESYCESFVNFSSEGKKHRTWKFPPKA